MALLLVLLLYNGKKNVWASICQDKASEHYLQNIYMNCLDLIIEVVFHQEGRYIEIKYIFLIRICT
jgi:hypothetical protein